MEDYRERKRLAGVTPPHGHGELEVESQMHPYLLDSGCSDSCMPVHLFNKLTAAAKRRGGYRAIEPVQFNLADPYQQITAVGVIELDLVLTTLV